MALLETRGLTKRFPGVLALDALDFFADAGEVHALVGANGAGKSTLMNLLAGLFPPTAGEIVLDGKPVAFATPRAARQAGISIVYQELSSLPALSVAENLFLAQEPAGPLGRLDRRRLRDEAQAVLTRHGIHLDPGMPVEQLSVAQRQLLEIGRALSSSSRVLILDEPSAVLAGQALDNLFATIRRLRDAGLLLLYVSHRLEEVFAIADRITVLRDGRKVDTVAAGAISQADLVRLMTGRAVRTSLALPPVRPEQPPLLRAAWGGSGLSLRSGEILGLAGLVGSGRTRLAQGLVGLRHVADLRVEIGGRPVTSRSPRQARRQGLLYLTEDRKRDGIFSGLSVVANTTAAALGQFATGGLLRRAQERSAAGDVLQKLRLVARSLQSPARELSGGNQQKLIIGRALLCRPRLLICDEPTRGVDVGAKDDIYEVLLQLAAQGLGILLISSEIKELLMLSHRLLVMREGQAVAELPRDVTEEVVIAHAAGVQAAALASKDMLRQ